MSGERRRGRAATAPDAADVSLRGRTCAIPFEDVWQSALALARGGLRGWMLIDADDHAGVIEARAERLGGAVFDVRIEVALDADAQTRVDAEARAHRPATDFGTSARLLRRFFRRLDRALARTARRSHASRT